MSQVSIWTYLKRGTRVFGQCIGWIAVPIFLVTFFEYWINVGLGRLRHSLVLYIWHRYETQHVGNSHLPALEVVPIGFLLQVVTWLVQFYLWAGVFAVIALTVRRKLRGDSISSAGAFAEALKLPGLPALLWRLFWRILLVGYCVTAGLGGIAILFYKISPRWSSFVQSGALNREPLFLITALVTSGVFLLYARRFFLAIPILTNGIGIADIAMQEGRQKLRSHQTSLWFLACVVVALSQEIERYLPVKVFQSSAEPQAYSLQVGIILAVSLFTGLIWGWFFILLTLLAIDQETPAGYVLPDVSPASM